ncbi:MAG: YidC/Oxa1 family membrane protein insertase, partial [bacterium]
MADLWNALLDGMGSVLAFLYSGIPSYGVAIIGLTVLVRLVLFPLTAKQARSQMKMTQASPEIKKIQAQYKDDRQKQNEEVMKYYKENKVNPVAGCLPLVAQMPIFFALFAVLRKPVDHIPEGSTLIKAFCDGASSCKDEVHGLRFLGMDLSDAASTAHDSFTDALPYFTLVGLVALTGYFQFKQTQARQTTANPQMAIIGKVFPVMFALISLSMPSGTVLYFVVSNLWQIGQQHLIFKTMPPPLVIKGGVVEGTAGPTKPRAGDGAKGDSPGELEGDGTRRAADRGRGRERETPTRQPQPRDVTGRAQPPGARP